MKDSHRHMVWNEISRKLVAKCRIFDVYSVKKSHCGGMEGEFSLLDTPEWVTVVPLIENPDGPDTFIMVRQYRHGSGDVTLEFPAGVVETGEDPCEAGIRELREETGYEPGEAIFLGSVNPNPAFMNNHTHVYLLRGLRKLHEQSLDEHEEVEVECVDEQEVLARMGTGPYANGVMLIALAFYRRWKDSPAVSG